MQIALLGHGVVGSGVKKIVDEAFSDKSLQIKKILVKDFSHIVDTRATTDMMDILNDSDIETVVECIGGLEPAHTYVKMSLEAHKNVVTANKKMLATYALELFELAKQNNVSLCYEACVGGGVPWIHECNKINQFSSISSFVGIMNGTTNYILSNMSKEHVSFEDALKKAQENGYAEKDPTDDICGHDVCYKTSLSAYTAFKKYICPEDIPTFGIQNINEADFKYASSCNRTIKLLGKGQQNNNRISAIVIPSLISNTKTISTIPENLNYFSCTSSYLGSASFIAQGAGSMPTAEAIVQDLLDIYHKNTFNICVKKVNNDFSSINANYYVRLKDNTIPHEFIQERINSTTCITKKITLQDLIPFIHNRKDLFLAEVDE